MSIEQQARDRPLCRMVSLERRWAYGSCTLRPVVDMAISWVIVRPQVAGSVSTPERQEADINRQRRLIGNFKVCAQSRLRQGLGRPVGILLVTDRTAALGNQISVCSEISKASSTSIPR